MMSFILKPWMGLKTNVPQNDPSLFQMVGDNVAIAYCVDGLNVDFNRIKNSCSKSEGRAQWSNSAVDSAAKCLGLFYFNNGSNTARYYFDGTASGGRVFRYDGSRDPVRLSDVGAPHAGAVEYANSDMDLYSTIRVGDFMVFSDHGEHTPYATDYNDATLIKLISSGTEYKFRFLEYFRTRVIGAYSDQTNGDIEIRWSGALDYPGSCSFAAGNQLYKPDDDIIAGIRNMGQNACFLYGENSIDAIDYYPNYSTPFGLRNIVSGQGAANNAGIVNLGGYHLLFNKNYGFCKFDGSPNFPAGGAPISYDIENTISTINQDYTGWISGKLIPFTNEVCWTVPLNGSPTPTHLLYYHLLTGTWRIEDKVAYSIDVEPVSTNLTWSDLAALGYVYWEDFGLIRWADLVQTTPKLVLGNTDGHLYYKATSGDNGSDLDGYRIEPVIDFGRPEDKDLLLEIWFGLESVGAFSMYCYYRGGNTLGEVKSKNWTPLTEMSCDSPATAVFRLAETNRFHQIKWGTDSADEAFSVNSIEFKYEPQGRY